VVTVVDLLPPSLTATAMTGTGWTCFLATLTCTRSDVLAFGASYPPITLTVNVSSTAPGIVSNTAGVAGGGDTDSTNNITADSTSVLASTTAAILLVVAITASPNVLPCSGGTSTITAVAIDVTGNPVTGVGFTFSTDAGQLVQTSVNTATLTLSPGMGTKATVTATTALDVVGSPGKALSATVTVLLACNDFVSVVVTASPNVVTCGGSSLITATVRDKNGHVVPGVGFHFTTNNGSLVVGPPTTAAAEQGTAILTLTAPGSSGGIATDTATVIVSVGVTLGTVEKFAVADQVTVQQFCQTSSQTAGTISLRASSPNVPCAGSVFIAATVRDVSGNVVPDDTTQVNFIATSGKITTTQSSSGSPAATGTAVPAGAGITATTKGGTLNVVYTADLGVAGLVTITAASGASFGSIDLQVCGGGAPVAGRIGITPPNTGDGGLIEALAAAGD